MVGNTFIKVKRSRECNMILSEVETITKLTLLGYPEVSLVVLCVCKTP
ncbi:hypothetical protein MIDIC_270001 [Alphaproteobacteria bacterium]